MKEYKRVANQTQRRRFRVRNRLKRDANRLRLSVHRSNKHCYAQIIDDEAGRIVASASTLEKAMRSEIPFGGNRDAAAAIGRLIAQRALEAGVNQVFFDRREYKYHGRIAALADAAREAGLVI